MQPILDVAIGLAFIYALTSLVITAATEFIATLFRLRAGMLARAVKQLLRDHALAETFYKHPLITVLSQPSPLKTRRPGYIPSKTFALTLADILNRDAAWKAEVAKLDTAVAPPHPPPPAKGPEGEVVPEVVQPARDPKSPSNKELDELRQILLILWQDAGKDAAAFRTALESMFNDAMDRVSGWYKRRADRIVFALGVFLTLLLNIDTIGIVRTLWKEPALRAAMVNEATVYVNEEAKKKTANEEQQAQTPKGPPPETPDLQSTVTLKDLQAQKESVDAALTKLRSISFPLGWANFERDPEKAQHLETFAKAMETPVPHAIGWLLTALALSLGAPFWFDTLSKLVSVRTSGKNPQVKDKK